VFDCIRIIVNSFIYYADTSAQRVMAMPWHGIFTQQTSEFFSSFNLHSMLTALFWLFLPVPAKDKGFVTHDER
jgi:hypothetical protein